jgi:signal transduction histidine kinase
LAPTVLVSLALVGACLFGALYLKRLHFHVSDDLSENVHSTQAANGLETVTVELIKLLREGSAPPNNLPVEVGRKNELLLGYLHQAKSMANHNQELLLVAKVEDGVNAYLNRWQERERLSARQQSGEDRALADILEQSVLRPCNDLHQFNAQQIERSNDENVAIVNTLSWGLLLVGVGAPVSGLLLGYAVARRLRQSIYQLSVGIRDATGRLNRQVGSLTLAEDGDLPNLHRQMQTLIGEIERVVDQLQQREREVLRAEQLAAVGQVAAGVAHELRNPLTSVKMLVQTGLEGDPPAGLPPDDLAIIEHEIRRIEQRIQLFLDFARPAPSERRRADLTDVLRRALTLVEGRARKQKVHLEVDLPEEPIVLFIDAEQIHQVIVNLLLNALDALPRGGTIRLGAQANPFSEVEVRVRDNGPGIAARIRERLFEPFVSTKESGVGLGLSISKRLIEEHGGTIRGRNEPEGGALFIFTLPFAPQELEPSHAELAGRGR